MQAPKFRFTFEKDWRSSPMAFWVHMPVAGSGDQWIPSAPAAVPHKGYPVLRVELGQHELQFSAPAQIAHCIEVLSTKPLPTSKQLSAKRSDLVGPNGHWLSRLPAELKAPRKREKVVGALQDVYREAVALDGASFKLAA